MAQGSPAASRRRGGAAPVLLLGALGFGASFASPGVVAEPKGARRFADIQAKENDAVSQNRDVPRA